METLLVVKCVYLHNLALYSVPWLLSTSVSVSCSSLFFQLNTTGPLQDVPSFFLSFSLISILIFFFFWSRGIFFGRGWGCPKHVSQFPFVKKHSPWQLGTLVWRQIKIWNPPPYTVSAVPPVSENIRKYDHHDTFHVNYCFP